MNRPLRLVHVTSSLKIGGAEAVLCDLIEQLPQEQFEHHVIYFHDGPNRQRLMKLGIPTYHIRGAFMRYDPLFLLRLYRLLAKLNPDGIHALLWAANVSTRMLAHLLTIPFVNVYHNNVDQDGALRNLLDRFTMRWAQQLVAVSKDVANTIVQNVPWFDQKRIAIVTNGINAHAIAARCHAQAVTRASLGLDENHLIIGSVGRFEPVKNYPLLIASFARARACFTHIRLVLVGQGTQERSLRDYASQMGIADSVIFVVGASAYGYYPLFDCFVQSSHNEGVSIALLEAMSCRRACIVTGVGKQHTVIIDHQSGLIVEAGNEQKLHDALILFIEQRALRTQLGQGAWEQVSTEFSHQIMLDAYSNLFNSFKKKIKFNNF